MSPDPGSVYTDDVSIPNDERLYRMVTTATTKWSGSTAVRGTTNAFQDQPESALSDFEVPATAVSIWLESELAKTGRTPADLLWDSRCGIVAVTAGDVRAEGQGIVRWPTEEDPEHGMIFVLEGAKKTKGQSKRIAASSVVIIPPPPPEA